MNIYLVDYENVGQSGINGLETKKDDKFFVFYTRNAKIDLDLVTLIQNNKVDIEFIKVEDGKNALDFQLCAFLGKVSEQYKEAQFYIISKDKGFKHLVDFMKNYNVSLEIISSLTIVKENVKEENTISKTFKLLKEKLPNEKNDLITQIENIIKKSSNKSDLHNKLVHSFSKNGSLIYRKIKTCFDKNFQLIV